MSEQEILRAAFKTAYLNKEHRFQPDMRRYGELGEYKDPTLESEFYTFCDGVKYGLAAQRDEGLAREEELREDRDSYQRVGIQCQLRLAEAEKLLREARKHCDWNRHPLPQAIDEFLATPDRTNEHKPE